MDCAFLLSLGTRFSPFLRDNLKVGNGQACRQNHGNDAMAVEVVIIISDNELLGPSSPSCLKAFEPKTEVLYFRDFSPCPTYQSAFKGLRSIKWNNYGLTPNIAEEESILLLEWENLSPNTHIDIALHCYNKQYPLQVTYNALSYAIATGNYMHYFCYILLHKVIS